MFGFLKNRVLKEHMNIVAQNYKALAYCQAFLMPEKAQEYVFIIAEINENWSPGERLEDEMFETMLQINTLLRQTYDRSPAKAFGMKAFDREFAPLLGWNEYYSHYL